MPDASIHCERGIRSTLILAMKPTLNQNFTGQRKQSKAFSSSREIRPVSTPMNWRHPKHPVLRRARHAVGLVPVG